MGVFRNLGPLLIFLIYCIFYLGMEKLTLVQNLALPLITAGFDCLIKSQTGSGKTLAYGIPLVQQLAAVEPKVVYSGVMSWMWPD